MLRHDNAFEAEVVPTLAAFDAAIAAGAQPALPIFREPPSERPPTRAPHGLVASGAAKALAPSVFFQLALFHARQASFGERYARYNDFTEQQVDPPGNDLAVFHDPGSRRLKPAFSAYVDRLRDLQHLYVAMTRQATELLDELGRAK